MEELDRIFLRVKVDGEWDSYSLKELVNMGEGSQVVSWFVSHVLKMAGYAEGSVITEGHARAMVEFLELNGTVVYKLKEMLSESPQKLDPEPRKERRWKLVS